MDKNGGIAKKLYAACKPFFRVTGGIVLCGGLGYHIIQNNNINDVRKMADEVGSIVLADIFFEDHPHLNQVCSDFMSVINNSNSINDRYNTGNIKYIKNTNYYSKTLCDDYVNYSFYNDCFEIKLLNTNENMDDVLTYHKDGSYSISCMYDRDIENILDNIESKNEVQNFDYSFKYRNMLHRITYNFNSDGILTDSVLSDNYKYAYFKYIDGDISSYDFYVGSSNFSFLTRGNNSYIIHDYGSADYKFLTGFSDIIGNVAQNDSDIKLLNNTFYDIQYRFDSEYKFEDICAFDDMGGYLKIDSGNNIDLKCINNYYNDKPLYIRVHCSDELSISRDSIYSYNNYSRMITDDKVYDKNGVLICNKNNNKVIYEKKDDKEFFYEDGVISKVIEECNNEVLTHYYDNGVIYKSMCDDYTISYVDGNISYVEGINKKVSVEVNGINYELNNGDFVSFDNGILSERRISNEEWSYYPNGLIRTYKNDDSNLYICYDKNENISRCSFNYLTDYYKKAFDPKENFSYIMNNIDPNYRLDCDLNGDFIVEFKDDISIVKNDKIEFSFNGDRLYNLCYRSFNGDTKFEFYNVNILNQKNGDEVHNVIIYDGKFSDERTFNYSTDEGIVHEVNVSNKTK